jgi:hypothetical protein
VVDPHLMQNRSVQIVNAHPFVDGAAVERCFGQPDRSPDLRARD